MIAMPLAYVSLSKSQAVSPSMQPACFQPIDSNVVNASIPTFFVGRNRDGFWVARDAKGEHGGIFLFRSSALAFARRAAGPFGCATVFPSEQFELDVENQGNPLVDYLKPLLWLLTSTRNRETSREA
jgi:hypothetical protein